MLSRTIYKLLLIGLLGLSPTLILASVVKLDLPGDMELVHYGKIKTPFYSEPVFKARLQNKLLYTIPGVARPALHTAWFSQHFVVYDGEDVLDIGTGTGVHAIFAADNARKVVASDIDNLAVENVRLNAKVHAVEHIVEARQGDLLKSLKANELFDVVLFNVDLPTHRNKKDNWDLHERFFKNVGKHLKNHGRIYYLTDFLNNVPTIQAMIEKNGLVIMSLDMVSAVKGKREPIVMMIQHKSR